MTRLQTVFCGMAIAAFAIGFSGCGEDGANPNLVPVTGTVTLDGEVLPGASLTFVGIGDTPGVGGVGVSDASGNFKVSHFRAGEGLDPGEYKVAVSKLVLANGEPIPEGTQSAAELDTRDLVPPKYNYDNTELKVNVTKGGAPVKLELTSK